jgi:hypothetical protein
MKPVQRVLCPDAAKHDLEKLQAVDEQRRGDHHPVFHSQALKPVLFAQDHCQQDHQDHQGCDEQQMLPGKKALGLALVSAKAKKFTHGNNLLLSDNRKSW